MRSRPPGALAGLHAVKAESFGLPFDTTIGLHHQPNTPSLCWREFYKEQRLMEMARSCLEAGRIDSVLMQRIEAMAARLETLLPQPSASLLHGDVWSGNVIAADGRVCFIDPAVYYGHNEVELAFILMGTSKNPRRR